MPCNVQVSVHGGRLQAITSPVSADGGGEGLGWVRWMSAQLDVCRAVPDSSARPAALGSNALHPAHLGPLSNAVPAIVGPSPHLGFVEGAGDALTG